MKYLLALLPLFILLSCDKHKDDDINNRQLITDFSYINPKGKIFSDSIIYLPRHGYALEINSSYTSYNGAKFKSNNIIPMNQSIFVQWKLKNLSDGSILKTETSDEVILDLYEVGRYRLTQYVYSNKENRDKSILPLDSISKILDVKDVLQVDSIHVKFIVATPIYSSYKFMD